MNDLKRLEKLAWRARRAFERVAEEDRWPSDLGGLCLDASEFLWKLAKENGITTEIGEGLGHWFVLFGDMIIDITSTQFGQPEKVAIIHYAEAGNIGDWWKLIKRHKKPSIEGDRYLVQMAERFLEAE